MDGFIVLAKYNRWMNQSIYEKSQKLGQENIAKDQKTFFGSILSTLNHLLIGDIFWLSRCSGDKSFFNPYDPDGEKIHITSLDQILYKDIDNLYGNRARIDEEIISYICGLSRDDLDKDIEYQTSQGSKMANRLEYILLHWFNHQTHHRGQITAMLSQQGVDYGLTDLIYIKDQI